MKNVRDNSHPTDTKDTEPSLSSLPHKEPVFEGKIRPSYLDSTPHTPAVVRPKAGAPNIVVILLDDAGFAQMGTFGGMIPTPALDRLAQDGLRYNSFHTTAMCTPTRAAILTGRNPHAIGQGAVVEYATGYPGYNGLWPRSAACIAEILKQEGYATAAIGKWHNTPMAEIGPSGPFHRWPTGLGFEYFYGFMGGAVNQWEPTLFENTVPVINPDRPKDYHLTTELVDRSIRWIDTSNSVAPDRPFFLWLAPGATHSPHHVGKEWIERFKGCFDDGWDVYRERALELQKSLGVVPPDAELTARPDEIPAWETLSADQKRLFSRMMEVFAAFTAHTDHELGRLFDHLRATDLYDNTLTIYVVGDNGASAEGGLNGTVDAMTYFNGIAESLPQMLERIEELGSARHYNHFPAGWAWAVDAPFQWMKRIASHLGGVRNPLVVTWPKGIPARGEIRSQFHHAVDLMPTLLEAAGIQMPGSVNGTRQQPVDGIAMNYTFEGQGPSRRDIQIFEMMSNRAIYKDGWWACARENVPWQAGEALDLDKSVWELYHLETDFVQGKNLADRHPEKLEELKKLFWEKAEQGKILPLDSRNNRMDAAQADIAARRPREYVFRSPIAGMHEGGAPDLKNRSFRMTARVDLQTASTEGVLVALGGRIGGYSWFIRNRRLHYCYNFLGIDHTCISSTEELPTGEIYIELGFQYDGGGKGKGGTVTFKVNGKECGSGRLERTVKTVFSRETFDVGMDINSPVGDYDAPFKFTGNLIELRIALGD